MSYRLIDANKIQTEYPKVNELPCIYVDLPNGLDNSYHFINTDDINTAHEQIGYEKGYRDGYASALVNVPSTEKTGKWKYVDYGGFGNYHCTACGKICFCNGDYDYCPNCGADMRETE